MDEVWSWFRQRVILFIPQDKQLNLNAVKRVIGARASGMTSLGISLDSLTLALARDIFEWEINLFN